MKRIFWTKPQTRQRIVAIMIELLMMMLPLIELDTRETITYMGVIGIMLYTIIVSILPSHMLLTKKYYLFDSYPLELALHLQETHQLTRMARKDLTRCGVKFDHDNMGWFVVDYDAPSFLES